MGKIKVVSIDGFDMTGKTALIKETIKDLESQGYKTVFYEVTYDHYLDYAIKNKNESYVIGMSLFDFLVSLGDTVNSDMTENLAVVINRSIPSSYAYRQLYVDNLSDNAVNEALISYGQYLKGYADALDLNFYYLGHSDMLSANEIYNHSTKDGSHTDELDKFNGFENYFSVYTGFNDVYKEFYKMFGFTNRTTMFESVSEDHGKYVSIRKVES